MTTLSTFWTWKNLRSLLIWGSLPLALTCLVWPDARGWISTHLMCQLIPWADPWCPDPLVGISEATDPANRAQISSAYGTWVGSWGAWAGALATIVGFLFIRAQIRREQKVLETQTSWTMYEASLGVLNTFIETPSLRKYFYDNAELPQDEKVAQDGREGRSQVLAAAEIIADHLENIVNSGQDGSIETDTYYVWVKYMRLLGLRSPAMRHLLSDSLACQNAEGACVEQKCTRQNANGVNVAFRVCIAEGQRYDPILKEIILQGIVPELCRASFEADVAREKRKNPNLSVPDYTATGRAPASGFCLYSPAGKVITAVVQELCIRPGAPSGWLGVKQWLSSPQRASAPSMPS